MNPNAPIEPRQAQKASPQDIILGSTLKSIETSELLANKQLSDLNQSSSDTASTLKSIVPDLKRSGEAYGFISSFLASIKGDTGEKGEPGPKGESAYTPEEARAIIAPIIPAPIPGRPGRDGIDAPSREEILTDLIPYIPVPIDGRDGMPGRDGRDGSPDTGEEIVAKINELDADGPKIDASHIKNLPQAVNRTITKMSGLQGVNLGVLGGISSGSTVTINSGNYLYFGDSGTDGSWRMYVNGTDFLIERRESSSWVEKGSFLP
jgi:hypothetical protein